MAASVRREVFYAGRVQGVGFRYNAQRIAQGFAVTGFVRNLPDRRVQLVAEGSPDELKRFLAAIGESMADHIRDQAVHESPATGQFTTFDITH